MTESASPAAPDPYPIRPIDEDEFDRFEAVDQHAFNGSPLSESDRQLVLERFEFDRSLAAFDGAVPVGVTTCFSFRLSVPGREVLPAAGVTFVAVLPTHRRRGVLTSLMRRQLADVRGRGEPLAVLWASEAVIYGRYGYGLASWLLDFTVERGEGALAKTAPADGALQLRIVDPPAVLPELAKVYDAVLTSRPGFFARDEAWWRRMIHDPAEHRRDTSPLRAVLAEDDSGPRGYALYSGTQKWEESLPQNVLTVRELMAADPAACAALWGDLLGRDLVREFRAGMRPVDDPLLHQLADPRRTRPRLSDGLWVRIIDVAGALAGRRYSCPVDVVIEVRDGMLASNAGRWRLATAASPDGPGANGLAAACVPVTSPADLSLDVTQLGAAYLGGTRLGPLAGAGLVAEHRPGAVRQLSAAMSWDPAPWCPMIF